MKWWCIYNMEELPNHYAQEKKPISEDHIFCDAIYMKCPEQATPQRQKVDDWLSGTEGRRDGE